MVTIRSGMQKLHCRLGGYVYAMQGPTRGDWKDAFTTS